MNLFTFLLSILLVISSLIIAGEGLSQMRFPLRRQKTVFIRLLEMGFHPDAVEKMLLGKPKPKPHPVTNDTVQLFKYLDNEYFAEVNIGHPGQKFKIILDTTKSDSYVPSSLCSYTSPACRKHKKYNHLKSSTYVDLEQPFSLANGFKGFLAMDLVHLGHVNVTNHIFAELTEMPINWYLSQADGMFGMGFKAKMTYHCPSCMPFFYRLLLLNKDMPNIFSFYLNRDESTSKGGSLLLGAIDRNHYNGDLNYFALTKPDHWQIQMKSVVINTRKENSTFCPSGCEAIMDTGVSTIGVPPKDLDILNQEIGAVKFMFGRYTVDCKNYLKGPDVTFYLGNGIPHLIKRKDYIQHVIVGPMHLCFTAFVDNHGLGDNVWSLGGSFLYRFYSVYDLEQKRVGLAKANL